MWCPDASFSLSGWKKRVGSGKEMTCLWFRLLFAWIVNCRWCHAVNPRTAQDLGTPDPSTDRCRRTGFPALDCISSKEEIQVSVLSSPYSFYALSQLCCLLKAMVSIVWCPSCKISYWCFYFFLLHAMHHPLQVDFKCRLYLMLFWEAQSRLESCINVLVCYLWLSSSVQGKNSNGKAPTVARQASNMNTLIVVASDL